MNANLVLGQRSAVCGEQDHRHEIGNSNRRRMLDAAHHLESELPSLGVLGFSLCIEHALRHTGRVGQCDRITESQIDFADPVLHARNVADEPTQRLFPFRQTFLHSDVVVHLCNLVETYGYGYQQCVLTGCPAIRINYPLNEAEFGRHQFAGSRAGAFYRPR